MAAEGDSTQSDDILSLEDLVRETAPMTGPAIAESVTAIDQVLQIEDPAFATELAELKEKGGSPEADVALDPDVDKLLEAEKAEQAAKGRKRLKLWLVTWPKKKIARVFSALVAVGPWFVATVVPAAKNGALKTVAGAKTSAAFVAGKIKAGLAWFAKLPLKSKALVVVVIAFAAGAVLMTRTVFKGQFLPSLERDFLVSFEPKADHAYAIASDDAWEDLNDPLRHPEHIVLIERLIVNLKPVEDDSNPMGLIDLYVEAGSKEAAVEIKDREAEVRDLVLRTMEQLTYEELVTDAGKTKLKVFLRKNLNDLMSRGRIRRVFYKSIVLKP